MQDVCLSSPRVAWELYHAARDALLLYEALLSLSRLVHEGSYIDGLFSVSFLVQERVTLMDYSKHAISFHSFDLHLSTKLKFHIFLQ